MSPFSRKKVYGGESTHGESYKNLMETHFNIQRRLYDYPFSLTTTPVEFEQTHQAFMAT
jgi:hypothetical protein